MTTHDDTDRCGYTLVDAFTGEEGPCGGPATGHRWYQGHEYEDAMEVACDRHANEGGRRLHAAERENERLRERLARVERVLAGWEARGLHRPPELARALRDEADGWADFNRECEWGD